ITGRARHLGSHVGVAHWIFDESAHFNLTPPSDVISALRLFQGDAGRFRSVFLRNPLPIDWVTAAGRSEIWPKEGLRESKAKSARPRLPIHPATYPARALRRHRRPRGASRRVRPTKPSGRRRSGERFPRFPG